MVTQRKRRVEPLRKSSKQPVKKRRFRKIRGNWKDKLIKFCILIILIVDLVLIFFIIKQCSKPAVIEEQIEEHIGPLQIEVLNGCGVPGIANKYTDYLRAQGFDVVKTDNFESFNVMKTVVIDRQGNRMNGIKIAEAMGLEESRVLQEVNDVYIIDATVILGRDFRQLSSWQKIGR